MNERAFRLDFFIAIAALLVSALTAGALVYQTRIVADQYAATIWPYLDVSSSYSRSGEMFEVVNDGLGPAIVRSAQLWVDGTTVTSWDSYLSALDSEREIHTMLARNRAAYLSGSPVSVHISTSSIGPSTIIRGGDRYPIFKISFGATAPAPVLQALLKHSVAIDLCYCSLNGSCWNSRIKPGQNDTSEAQPVSRCARSAAIGSGGYPAGPHK
ncbi:MAG: hypothetical protein JO195_02585 [Candidatus Eremiobacteraeota bacterium]|nr:hypothetical protein [Candidatus Eremiobacteraeota bacterium]MBV8460499.1 hypothetical protein [Candidatus Eremiobacteraeota bacterium]